MKTKDLASSENDMNQITIQGSIVGIYSIGKLTILNISTQNAGSSGGKDKKNYPSIVFLNELSTTANNYKKYDNVRIVCHAAYKRRKNPDGSLYFKQGFFADSIEPTKKRMSSMGIDTGGYEPPENTVMLKGEITSVTTNADAIRTLHLMIQGKGKQFKDAVDVVAFTPALIKTADNLKKGDVVAILGAIQTKRSENKRGENNFTYFQNIVASEIKKVGERAYVPEDDHNEKEKISGKAPEIKKGPVSENTDPETSDKPKKTLKRVVRRIKKSDKEN